MIDIWTMVHVNFIAYSKSVRKVMFIFSRAMEISTDPNHHPLIHHLTPIVLTMAVKKIPSPA